MVLRRNSEEDVAMQVASGNPWDGCSDQRSEVTWTVDDPIIAKIQAARAERETGLYWYYWYGELNKVWYVTNRMPLMGRWYDSDGIQH